MNRMRVALPDTNVYYKAVVTKDWHHAETAKQMELVENLETDHVLGSLQRRKDGLSINVFNHKINSRWIF